MPIHTTNACGKFHLNPFTKYRDIVAHEIYVNRQKMDSQRMDRRTTRKHETSCCLLEA